MSKLDDRAERLLPLTPAVYHILLALADEDRHGLGIMQDLEERTGGKVLPGPGTLYGTIKRMLESGLIEEAQRPEPELDDPRRRYYRHHGSVADSLPPLLGGKEERKTENRGKNPRPN